MIAYEIRKPYKRLVSLHELTYSRNTNFALYSVIGWPGKFVALQDMSGMALGGVHELIITESHKVPLYKQAMDMEMGRKPRATTESRKVIRLMPLDVPINKMYDVYIARV